MIFKSIQKQLSIYFMVWSFKAVVPKDIHQSSTLCVLVISLIHLNQMMPH